MILELGFGCHVLISAGHAMILNLLYAELQTQAARQIMLELGAIIFSKLGKLPEQRAWAPPGAHPGAPPGEHHLATSRLHSPKAADLGDLAAEDASCQPGGKGVIEALSQSVTQSVSQAVGGNSGGNGGGQADVYGTAGGSRDGHAQSDPDSGDAAPVSEGAGTKAAGAYLLLCARLLEDLQWDPDSGAAACSRGRWHQSSGCVPNPLCTISYVRTSLDNVSTCSRITTMAMLCLFLRARALKQPCVIAHVFRGKCGCVESFMLAQNSMKNLSQSFFDAEPGFEVWRVLGNWSVVYGLSSHLSVLSGIAEVSTWSHCRLSLTIVVLCCLACIKSELSPVSNTRHICDSFAQWRKWSLICETSYYYSASVPACRCWVSVQTPLIKCN